MKFHRQCGQTRNNNNDVTKCIESTTYSSATATAKGQLNAGAEKSVHSLRIIFRVHWNDENNTVSQQGFAQGFGEFSLCVNGEKFDCLGSVVTGFEAILLRAPSYSARRC